MVKGSELRLGNFVDVPNKNQSPFRIDYFDETKVYQNTGYYNTPFGMVPQHPLTWDIKDIQPIPLTPEILEKAGFEMTDGNYRLELVYPQVNLDWFDDGLYLTTDVFIKIKHVKYLHQLQNFYHVLTWEELEINLL